MSKTIDFNAKADSVFSTMDKITQKSKAMFDQEVQNAAKYETSIKNQIKLLEEKAKVLDQNSKKAQAAVRDYTDDFELNKQKKLASLDKELENIGKRKTELKADYKRGDLSTEEYKDALKNLTNSQKDFTSLKNNVSGSKAQDQEEYRLRKEQARDTRTLASTFREQVENSKRETAELVRAIRVGDKDVVESIRSKSSNPELTDRLITQLEQEDRDKKKKDKDKDSKGGLADIFGGLALLNTLNNFTQTLRSFTGTQNGFDQISNIRSTEGQILGGVLGGIIGTIIEPGAGTAIGASAGASFLSNAFGAEGDIEQRHGLVVQQYRGSQYQRKALTGQRDYNAPPMDSVGLDPNQYLQLQMSMLRSQGTNIGTERNTNSGIYFDKVFGVQESTSTNIAELLRSSKEGQRDVGNLLGGILKAGEGNIFKNGDRTFFNEFLSKNFSSLQKELLKSQSSVATGTTFDLLKRFDSLGGPFAARDSRSLGLINQVNNALTSPQSDVAKALSFNALRKLYPGKDLEGLLEEQQKGLSSPEYLKAMMTQVRSMGGSHGSQVVNFANLVGLSGNYAAARELYDGRSVFNSKISQRNLSSPYSDSTLRTAAEASTTELEKGAAAISLGFLKSAEAGATAIAKAIKDALNTNIVFTVVDNRLVMSSVKKNIVHEVTKSKHQSVSNLSEKGLHYTRGVGFVKE